ncbi:penicillin-binding protein activator [Devosia nitrariae]|uniref:Penicillin-binding protein activator n=1 Tax=Devosia nitrariae TaxID=2071872 RepID=A0ABQ5WEF6_9HYPH|nr:penicillin-binding protein activator [Devosia nitrariae]GLQ58166.1 penicillin-binding protein activator [Devosia nitrariae]
MPRAGTIRKVGLAALAVGAAVLAACTPTEFAIGSRTITLPFGGGGQVQPQQAASFPTTQPAMASGVTQSELPPLQQASGESIGRGPVRVALLLPLTGDATLSSTGHSMANGARLAMSYIETNPNIAENTTIVIKDTGVSIAGATGAAADAVSEGASLILGPMRADQVTAAGAVARSAGIPLIGFSNTPAAAGPGVYLLNILPETELRRSLAFAQRQGRRRFAAIVPTTTFGQAQEAAFRQTVGAMGFTPSAVHQFASATDARRIVDNLEPRIRSGEVDALFLPDRTSAPLFAGLISSTGVARQSIAIIGSADWEGDPTIAATPFLAGALYPAVDEAGYRAILADYQTRFGGVPHRLTTLAYTATILANAAPLSMAQPKYNAGALTNPQGFNGRDGLFRFAPDGKAQMALVMKEVRVGGAVTVDGARL